MTEKQDIQGMAATFRLSVLLNWSDCDPAGIIYYPSYYRWMDAATWALLAGCGWPAQRIRDEHIGIPAVDSQCAFMRSPTFGDLCEVHTSVARCSRSSFTLQHGFFRKGEAEPLASGSETRVWCRYEAGPGSPLHSIRIPDELRAAMGGPSGA